MTGLGWLGLLLAIVSVGAARADAPPDPSTPREGRIDWLDVGVVLDAESIRVRSETGATLIALPPNPALAAREVGAGATVVVTRRDGGFEVDVAGARTAFGRADTLFIGGPGGDAVVIGAKRYRGGAKIFLGPRGRITVANRVSVQSYLRGVLPHEIGKLEPATIEAGKAQAVAARTYTLSYIGRRHGEGFDLFDSVEDQVYGGTVDEGPHTDRAVLETAGKVVLHDRSYIRANYHSTCGGATVNVEDVWPDPRFPWLRQVEDGDVRNAWCKGSRHFRWVERWSGSEALSIFNRFGPEQSGIAPPRGGWKELRNVRVGSRSPSGRVRELVFTTERGDIVVFADRTRWALRRPAAAGGGILRSSLFKVAVEKDRRGRVTSVIASGGGNGHGAGMCQVGALAQSRAGRSHEEILRFYYSGVDIVRR
ncbi:MAG: SpoIID/LytB domain-containing protein [Candidatus Eisenbacteria bacterium]